LKQFGLDLLLVHGFDLAAFRVFLAQLPPQGDRAFFIEALEEAREAHQAGNDRWLRRCLMHLTHASQLWLAVPLARSKLAAVNASRENGRRRGRERRTYTDEDERKWLAMAAGPGMPASMHGKAKKIAVREGMPLNPWKERVRTVLKKAAAAKEKKLPVVRGEAWMPKWVDVAIEE
jgi:hypothetical protein